MLVHGSYMLSAGCRALWTSLTIKACMSCRSEQVNKSCMLTSGHRTPRAL